MLKNKKSISVIGNSDVREKLICVISNPASLIHPKAVISNSAAISDFCVIEANAVINNNAHIGETSYVCAGEVVNHDAYVGSFFRLIATP